jgi:hypothetical protein
MQSTNCRSRRGSARKRRLGWRLGRLDILPWRSNTWEIISIAM